MDYSFLPGVEEYQVSHLDFVYPGDEGETILDEPNALALKDKIVKTFDTLNREKESSVAERWRKIEKAVRGAVSRIESERSNALVPYGKQSLQTLLAHFWGRSLQSDKMLFSVRGKDKQSKEQAPLQRENLLLLLKEDKFQPKMDDGVCESLMKGVVIGHVGYEEKVETERVLSGQMGTQVEYETDEFDQPLKDASGNLQIKFIDKERVIKSSPTVTLVDAHNFVFDTSNHKNWDSCFKAYQTFETYEDLLANTNYKNVRGLDELKPNSKKPNHRVVKTRGKKDKQKTDAGGFDEKGRIEVLEFHGDVRLEDGTYLRNWTVVIAGRCRIIRFERNPYYVNPFVKHTFETTDDGWGISPLEYIIPLIEAGSTMLNTSVEAGKLAINPPMLAPKGMFPQKRVYMTEGRIIEFEIKNNTQTIMPQPFQPKYDAAFPFLQLFETQSEATTGATRQLSGNITSNDNVQTATEFQGLQVVGNLVIERSIDLFNIQFKIPLISLFAKIVRMFNPEEREIPIENDKGLEEFKKVTPEVYYGNYAYYIEDSKSEMERKTNIKEKIELIQMMMRDPELAARVKKFDLVSEIWKDLGYGKAGSYLMGDDEYALHKLTQIALEQFITQIGSQKSMGLLMAASQGAPTTELIQQFLLSQEIGAPDEPVDPTQGIPPGAGIPQESPGLPGMAGLQDVHSQDSI